MSSLINKSINANQLDGMTTLTGKLHFDEDGFVFKAQSVNGIQNQPKIAYRDVEEVKGRNTLGIIPNGITVRLKDGTCKAYVVTHRKDVISFLNNTVRNIKK